MKIKIDVKLLYGYWIKKFCLFLFFFASLTCRAILSRRRVGS